MDGRVDRDGRLGDRRRAVRFEIVGHLWASLDARTTFRLVDLSLGGALVESGHPLTPGAAYDIRLTAGDETSVVPVRIQRVGPPSAGSGYRIGLEFMELPAAARRHINGLLAAGRGATEPR